MLEHRPPVATRLPMPSIFAGTLMFNTLIAVFISVMGVGGSERGFIGLLPENFVWSQCIGLSVAWMTILAVQANPPGTHRLVAVIGAVTGGTAVGVVLAQLMAGMIFSSDSPTTSASDAPWQALFIGLFFGGIASVVFWLRERNSHLSVELEVREMARLEAEKRGIEAQLKMLQAQIEPHFLFNSLANVSCLIQREPVTAGLLLDALIRYLRSSLARTRANGGTLGDEVSLLSAYLDVLKIRMGDRLRVDIDIPPELLTHPLPPMLLQPLVENAITHGLEPKIEGGTVRLSAAVRDGLLVLEISDDGCGIPETPRPVRPGGGVGLSNIRSRLDALYGPPAHLQIDAKVGAGVTARIVIPMEPEP